MPKIGRRTEPTTCVRCKTEPARDARDSMCWPCRKEYVRLWKAKQRHGDDWKAKYKPYNQPKVKISLYIPTSRGK